WRNHERAHGGPLPHLQGLAYMAAVHAGSIEVLMESGADDHVLAARARSFVAAWTAVAKEQNAEWAARGLGQREHTTAEAMSAKSAAQVAWDTVYAADEEVGEVDGL
ncbi:hypothetical protein, partial [Mycolicibacterium sp.]|uniref:hypothetical protein n=1 Tax=Mycolicibacterium sp. TaxID=2320850 RepID=UPI00355CA80C